MRALVEKFVDVRDDTEFKGLLWSIAYGFLIMSSYYILRAVRDEIGAADQRNLQLLWTAVFFVMLLAVPLYSWAASRWSRGVFVPLANRFFIACLVAFWLSSPCSSFPFSGASWPTASATSRAGGFSPPSR
jgi:AAA family ATP:ADP antiporter